MGLPVALATGVLGAIAGAQGNQAGQSGTQDSTTSMQLQDINQLNVGRSGTEAAADSSNLSNFNGLNSLVGAGPGQNEVAAATGFGNQYASQLQQLLSQGPTPNQDQVNTANTFAKQAFAPQQAQLGQQFYDQGIQSQRLAAQLGRPVNDPILQNKLMQEQTRQQTVLNAQQGAFGAQYAQQLPQMQVDRALQVGGALSNVRNGLASQAFANRNAMVQLGNQLTSAERNYRIQTATKNTSSQYSDSSKSGGGLAGAIGGAGALVGTAMSAFGPSGGGGGGGAGPVSGGGGGMTPTNAV